MDNDSGTGRRLVCYCFEKTAEEIRSEILRLGIKTPGEAMLLLCAGSGCTLCRTDIEKILAEVWGTRGRKR